MNIASNTVYSNAFDAGRFPGYQPDASQYRSQMPPAYHLSQPPPVVHDRSFHSKFPSKTSSTVQIPQQMHQGVMTYTANPMPPQLPLRDTPTPKSSNIQRNTQIKRSDLCAYSNQFIERFFKCDTNPPPSFVTQISLSAYLMNIMNRTRINSDTLVTAFYYLDRLKQKHPRCKGSPGSGHRLFLSATMLAAKYLYDDTFDNTAWSTVSSGLFDLTQVNHMEREMLGFLDFDLYIHSQDWMQFYNWLFGQIYGVSTLPVPQSVQTGSLDRIATAPRSLAMSDQAMSNQGNKRLRSSPLYRT